MKRTSPPREIIVMDNGELRRIPYYVDSPWPDVWSVLLMLAVVGLFALALWLAPRG